MKQGIKKIAIIMMFALLAVSMIPEFKMTANAETVVNYTTMGCSAYEVSNANADGSFTVIDCRNSFSEAVSLMKSSGENAVVRHNSSKSPMKIIAMNSGIAATYAFREPSGSSVATTATIWQYATVVANEKKTYITSHREVAYFDTYSFNESTGNGYVHINSSGFDGYMYLKQVDLIPNIFIENNVRVLLGGNTAVANYEEPFYVYTKRAYFTVEQNGSFKELVFHFSSQWAAQNNYEPASYTYAFGPAADWMNVGDVYYSYDYVNYYSDRNYTSFKGTYYNYYMYLPLRSQSNITADQLESYLSSKGYNTSNSKMAGNAWVFIEGQNQYGVNALLVYAMGCLESGYGTSSIAMSKNNLFGWAAVDSDPNDATAYPSISSAILQHMNYNLRGYMDITDARFFGSHLGNKGSGFNVKYASDPYWGVKIASIAYEIDKYAGGNNGTLLDYNYYSIGVLNQRVDIKKSADASSAVLYNAAFGATYQKDFTVIINQNSNGWVQLPTTNALSASGAVITNSDPIQEYNWQQSVGYVQTAELSQIIYSRYTDSVLPKPGMIHTEMLSQDIVNSLESLSWENGFLSIKGTAYQPGFMLDSYDNIEHVLVLTDTAGNKTWYNLDHISASQAITGVKGLDYTKSGYTSSSIDLRQLASGTYTLSLQVTVKNGSVALGKEISLNASTLPSKMTVGQDLYRFSSDNGKLTLFKEYNKASIEVRAVNVLRELSWKENKLYIKGTGYIMGADNNNLDTIKKNLLVLNIDDDSVAATYPLNVIDKKVDLADGYDYQYAWYDGEIDLSILRKGTYKFKLEIILEGVSYQIDIKSSNISFEIEPVGIQSQADEKNYFAQITENAGYAYRLELKLSENVLKESSPTLLPSRRPSVVTLKKIDFVQKESASVLTLEGLGYIRYTPFVSSDTVFYQLILENMDTEELFRADLATKACEVDYTAMYNSENDLSHICYSAEIDMSVLPNGSYNCYMRMQTKPEEGKDYVDVISVTSVRSDSITEKQTDTGTYKFAVYGYNNRYVLQVNNNVPAENEAEAALNEEGDEILPNASGQQTPESSAVQNASNEQNQSTGEQPSASE